jgi:hypothetical protein
MRAIAIVFGIAVQALIVTGAPAMAGPGNEVGFVASFDNAASLYTLKRDDVTRAVTICMQVLQDDEFAVTSPQGRLELHLTGSPDPVIVTLQQSPYKVVAPPPKQSFWTPLLAWAAGEFNVMDASKKVRFSAAIRAGHEKFSAPILRSPQSLGAGKRSLAIAWRGARPAHIVLRSASSGKIISEGSGSDGRWTSQAIDLRPGHYIIEIAESETHSTKGEIDVLPPDRMPQLPDDLKRPEIPSELRMSAQAAWLASQSKQAFMLEALQLLGPLRTKFEPAETLASELTDGRAPAAP